MSSPAGPSVPGNTRYLCNPWLCFILWPHSTSVPGEEQRCPWSSACKETTNHANFNDFQLISVGLEEGWWPGADLAVADMRDKLDTGEEIWEWEVFPIPA